MTELEVEVARHFANLGFGVFGTGTEANRTIYINDMPQGVVEGIVLINIPSPPPHQYIDTEYAVIDFWSRSPHSDRAKDLLRNVFETYHRRSNWETDNWYIYFSQALGNINDADRDREGGKLFRLSIQFICRNINHLS